MLFYEDLITVESQAFRRRDKTCGSGGRPLTGVWCMVTQAVFLCMSSTVAFAQEVQPQGEVTFVLSLLQGNQESRTTLAGKREAIRGSLGEPAAFDRTDSMRVHLFRQDGRVGEDVSNLKTSGAIDELSTVRMIAPLGREALWVVGGEDVVPAIAFDGAAQQDRRSVPRVRREFGLRLSLVAWLLPDGGLRVRVRPTVSAVDFGKSTVRGDQFEPALVSRRTDTYLDVKLGQSFAITGALDDSLLNKLIRSQRVAEDPLFQAINERQKARPGTVLVLLVTPESVRPIASRQAEIR